MEEENRRGLINMGATCFMNSVLQILISNPVLLLCKQLRECCSTNCSSSKDDDVQQKFCICCALMDLSHAILSRRYKQHAPSAVVPSRLLYSVWKYADYMAGYAQQDAHEFLIAFLDGLQAHAKDNNPPCNDSDVSGGILKRPRLNVPGVSFNPYTKYFGLPLQCIHEVFNGKTQSNLTCKTCGHTSTMQESFVDLSLSLSHGHKAPTGSKRGQQQSRGDGSINLADCLKHFTAVETLSEKVFCEQCGSGQVRQKQLSVSMAPHILILHLKRFDLLHHRKVTTRVRFSLQDLDLTPFTADFTASRHSELDWPMSPRSRYQQQVGRVGATNESCNNNNNNSSSSTISGTSGGGGSCSKDSDNVFTIDLPSLREEESSLQCNNSALYDLQGVVCHSGSLNQGHYIGYVADYQVNAVTGELQLQWLRCDDEEVRIASEQEVLEAEAYILFYVQKSYIKSSRLS